MITTISMILIHIVLFLVAGLCFFVGDVKNDETCHKLTPWAWMSFGIFCGVILNYQLMLVWV